MYMLPAIFFFFRPIKIFEVFLIKEDNILYTIIMQ